jgi:hypothetical protein
MKASIKNDRIAWLEGPSAKCAAVPKLKNPWRLILLGAPGLAKEPKPNS